MALIATKTFTGDGSNLVFVFTYPYLQASHITITIDDVVTTDYTLSGSTATFNSGFAPANGTEVKIVRDSDITQKLVAFADGSNLTEEDLNDDASQGIYLQQETRDAIENINGDNAAVVSRVDTNETDIATNVADIATNVTDIATNATNLSDHEAETTGAHAASSISNTASGNLTATDQQAVNNELQADIDTRALATAVTDHTGDATDAHAGSAITNTPAGTIAATTVQGAINEIDGDLTTHYTDTSTHGVSTVVGASETQTLTNKTFDDEIVLKEITTPSTPASGYKSIFPKADGKLYSLDDAGVETEIGAGGGGGLDVYHNDDFSTTISTDFNQGNAATVDAAGTGTLDGTLSDETSAPIAGTQSLKYVMSTSSTNDFFIQDEDIAVDVKQRANFSVIDFYYTYDGDDNDLRFFLLDQDDSEITLSNEYLKSASAATRFSSRVYIPSGTTGIRYGIQVVTGNSTKVLVMDDIQISTNPFFTTNLAVMDSCRMHTGNGHGSTNTTIRRLSNIAFDNDSYTFGSIASTQTSPNGLFEITDSAASGTEITILKRGEYKVEYMDSYSAGQGDVGLSLNSTQLTTSILSITTADCLKRVTTAGAALEADISWAGVLEVGDVLRAHDNGNMNATSGANLCNLTISGVSQSEHVITPAKSTLTDWVDDGGISLDATTTAPTKPTTSITDSVKWRRVGDSAEIRIEYRQSSSSGGAAGSGDYKFLMPAGLKIDTTKVTPYTTTEGAGLYLAGNIVGNFDAYTGSQVNGAVVVFDEDYIRLFGDNKSSEGAIGSGFGGITNNATLHYNATFTVPIQGWTSDVTFLAAVPTNVQNNATDYVTETMVAIGATTTAPTPATTVDKNEVIWAQCGQNIKATYKYYAASTSGSSAGSGDYLYTLPNGLSFDSNVVDYYTTAEGSGGFQIVNGQIIGSCSISDGADSVIGVVVPYDATRFRLFGIYNGSEGVHSSSWFNITSTETIAIQIDAPIQGWTNAGTFLATTPTIVNATDYVTQSGITIEGTTSDPTKPTTMDTDEIIWSQMGQNLKATYKYYAASVTGSVAGSGDYLFTLPTGLQFDPNIVDYYTTAEGNGAFQITNSQIVGTVMGSDGDTAFTGCAVPYDATRFRMFELHSNASTHGRGVIGSAHLPMTTMETIQIQIDAPILGWTTNGSFLRTVPRDKTCIIEDQQTAGTAAGAATATTWHTRDINTIEGDNTFCTVSSNQFTLQAGTYDIDADSPCYRTSYSKVKIYDVTNSADVKLGVSCMAGTVDTITVRPHVKVRSLVVTEPTTFDLRLYATAAHAAGLGLSMNVGIEIYSSISITKKA